MKKILFAVALISSGLLYAQVTLQPVVPTVGMIQKSQLWNILVINSSVEQLNCRLDIVVKDRLSNMEVLTASTGVFSLAPGAKQLNAGSLNPIQYNFVSPGFDTKLQGAIPVGNYVACYSITQTGPKTSNLAEECIQFDVEPLSPPMLITPADSTLLEPGQVQLSWIPPAPVAMFNRLQYDILIVPVNEGQKAEEAIQENLPFYSETGLSNVVLNYPSSAMAFEKDKWYAWQVVARDERSYGGKTETRVFKLTNNKQPVFTGGPSYIELGAGNDKGVVYLNEQSLKIKYHCYDPGHVSNILFYNSEKKIVKHLHQKLIYGDNFFSLKINSGTFIKGQVYTVELTTKEGVKHIGRFIIQ